MKNKKIMIGTRIKKKTAENLNKVANKKEWTVSKTIRKILEDYLK